MANIISEKKYKFELPANKKGERIDVYLTSVIENATRSKVQKLIKAEGVIVNGKTVKPNYVVNPFDVIDVTVPIAPRPDEVEPEEIPLDVIHEDEHIIIINKAPGMVVHPAYANYTGTLVNALLHHTQELSEYNEPGRPGIVHRIDKDTSGILVIAKDDVSHAFLAKQFEDHSIQREYWAVCWGQLKEPKGEIVANITRSLKDRKVYTVSKDESVGKYAHTFYEQIEQFDFATLVKLHLKTGRTHQIRVHMNHINHALFGDPVYGGQKILYGHELPKMKARVNNLLKIIPRQALHAKTLGFIHPGTKKEVFYESPLPDDMVQLIEQLRK